MTPRNSTAAEQIAENVELDRRFGRKHRSLREATAKTIRVLVAGQVPPPVCGQNLNIARVLGLLGRNPRFRAEHWAFRFSPTWSQVRRAGPSKVIELIRVCLRLLWLRAKGPIDVILYPVGGPHLAPVLRDLCLLPLARLCSKRVVLHFRAAGFAEALPGFPERIRNWIQKVYRACGEAIVLTDFGKRDPVAAGIPEDKIAVIANGSEDRYRGGLRKRRRACNPTTILNVGLLCPDKGTPALVEAFCRLAQDRKDIRLKLVGEPMGGSTSESLLETACDHDVADRVELHGVLSGADLDRAYAGADLFVFPTVAPFESFGMVLIEAMMWGLPIVATDWRGNSEVMGAEPGGLLVPAAEDLASSLEFGIEAALERSEAWAEWGARNRSRFESDFRIDRLERRLARFLESS